MTRVLTFIIAMVMLGCAAWGGAAAPVPDTGSTEEVAPSTPVSSTGGARKCVAIDASVPASNYTANALGGEWSATYDNGIVVHGISACRNKGSAVYYGDTLEALPEKEGGVCFCKVISPTDSSWSPVTVLDKIYYDTSEKCAKRCAQVCASAFVLTGTDVVPSRIYEAFRLHILTGSPLPSEMRNQIEDDRYQEDVS